MLFSWWYGKSTEIRFPGLRGQQFEVRRRQPQRCTLTRISFCALAHMACHVRTLAMVLAQRLRSNNALLLDLLSDDDAKSAPSSKAVVSVSPTLTADRPQVVVREEIRLTDLRDIIDSRVLAVRVPGWYTSRQCQQLCRRLMRHTGISRYSIAPDVGVQRIAFSHFETRGDEERLAVRACAAARSGQPLAHRVRLSTLALSRRGLCKPVLRSLLNHRCPPATKPEGTQ